MHPIPPTVPNWPAFRRSILASASFQAWEGNLPTAQRENLKLAAVAEAPSELQAIYNALLDTHTPGLTAAREWQAFADLYSIPIKFTP